jgi:hypothetical protein
MASSTHTYGPTCHLANAESLTGGGSSEDIPPLRSYFFYSSPLPIDDPLSTVPVSSSNSSAKLPPIPFSAYDSSALERVWLALGKEPAQNLQDTGRAIGKGQDSLLDQYSSNNAEQQDLDTHRNNKVPLTDKQTPSPEQNEAETAHTHRCQAQKISQEDIEVPVGISRLHLVKLPDLQMKPIYWSPINDIAAVVRGTWFYKDTMYPVEPALANELELGYRERRPWSEAWRNELTSALELGAAGEEKIAYTLWPDKSGQPLGPANIDQNHGAIASRPRALNQYCAARCFRGEMAVAGTIGSTEPGEKTQITELMKRFRKSQVFYQDSKAAFILQPSYLPPPYFGRRPLANINKGYVVGIPVVRGFDQLAWDKLHPSKKSTLAFKGEQAAPATENATIESESICYECQQRENRPKVSDLVLVIHGIGQKLSEKVEAFHFTHAINSFRRLVNIDMGNDNVKKALRKDFGGMMLLPVNWRSGFSSEEKEDKAKALRPHFSLNDITPDSIPAIRDIVSNILFDIPYYMSHLKWSMLEALTAEPNRVYRLWCQNNPDFQKEGRVHIIAHSLGSAMAVDVLSRQPTYVPPLDLHKSKIQREHFEFNTTNLILIGSPAAFFMLLERGRLQPRKGRSKPGVDYINDSDDFFGEAGSHGCLAVENLYNVMQPNDPVAYALNKTVDVTYASKLEKAIVPSSNTGWMGSIGIAVRSMAPGASSASELADKTPTGSLPFQLEKPAQNLTREEIAERKFYLLNDNGQIDFLLTAGGGPLELQYLDMLSAHTSYWDNPDFIRMVVTEIGRKPGRAGTLPNMRAVKKVNKEA